MTAKGDAHLRQQGRDHQRPAIGTDVPFPGCAGVGRPRAVPLRKTTGFVNRGQRFLMLRPVESQASAPTQINVVLNWFEELKQKVPVK